MKLKVQLNGTDANPWHRYGLRCNPFPQTGDARYDGACMRLQELGGDPIPQEIAEKYIRTQLEGFAPEFVDLVLGRYVPGEMIEFEVAFPEAK